MNFRPRGFRPVIFIFLSILFTTKTSALESNPERSPQILSDTTEVCVAAGRTSTTCEVAVDVPAACLPGGASSSDCPIVFFFHGAGGSNNGFAGSSGVHSETVIGVYPQGEDGWNTGPKSSNTCDWDDYGCTSDPDEGEFIASIIDVLRLRGATGNVYLIGNSNGAALSHRLASNAGPDDLPIKGIVTKVTQLLASPSRNGPGELNYNQPRSGGPAVSVLNLMGLDDELIPYDGGGSAVFGGDATFQLASALESMATWAAHNGCESGAPAITSGIVYSHNSDANAGEATFYNYQGCPEGVIVQHYALGGAGHSFRAGAALDGIAIDHDLAYQFIRRVEASGGGGGGGTASPVAAPTDASSAPTPAPIQSATCEDDPDWHGKFNVIHTCSHIAVNPTQRCGWESADGTEAADACKVACDTCPITTPSPVTPAPVASSPTNPPVALSPTPAPVQSVACEDDPDWHGKMNVIHTCSHVAENREQRCVWESTDGIEAADACKVACDTCPTTAASPVTPEPMVSSPTNSPLECENDPNWVGEFDEDDTCEIVAYDPTQRCVWESTDGTKAVDACKLACDNCHTPGTSSPTNSPSPTSSPTGSPPPSSSPTSSCIPCTNKAAPWMSELNYDCATAPDLFIDNKCDLDPTWVINLYCEQRCQIFGSGYDTGCCMIESSS